MTSKSIRTFSLWIGAGFILAVFAAPIFLAVKHPEYLPALPTRRGGNTATPTKLLAINTPKASPSRIPANPTPAATINSPFPTCRVNVTIWTGDTMYLRTGESKSSPAVMYAGTQVILKDGETAEIYGGPAHKGWIKVYIQREGMSIPGYIREQYCEAMP